MYRNFGDADTICYTHEHLKEQKTCQACTLECKLSYGFMTHILWYVYVSNVDYELMSDAQMWIRIAYIISHSSTNGYIFLCNQYFRFHCQRQTIKRTLDKLQKLWGFLIKLYIYKNIVQKHVRQTIWSFLFFKWILGMPLGFSLALCVHGHVLYIMGPICVHRNVKLNLSKQTYLPVEQVGILTITLTSDVKICYN